MPCYPCVPPIKDASKAPYNEFWTNISTFQFLINYFEKYFGHSSLFLFVSRVLVVTTRSGMTFFTFWQSKGSGVQDSTSVMTIWLFHSLGEIFVLRDICSDRIVDPPKVDLGKGTNIPPDGDKSEGLNYQKTSFVKELGLLVVPFVFVVWFCGGHFCSRPTVLLVKMVTWMLTKKIKN